MNALSPIPQSCASGALPEARVSCIDPGLLADVIALRDSTEAAFLATGAQLIDIATLLADAKLAAVSINSLALIDLLNRLRDEADVQSQTFAALAAEFSDAQSAIRRLSSDLADLGRDLQGVGRSVVTMRSVVLNARVTQASLRQQDRNLLSYAESGQTVVAEISDLLMRFEQTMDDILKAVDQTQLMVGQIDATMRSDVLSAFAALMRDLSGFDKGVRAVGGRGAELSRKLQSLIDATSRAVSGLQVGDSTRQQLDHIAAILSRPDASEPVLGALVGALLVAASQEHSAMLVQLQASVTEMAAGLSDLVEVHLSGFFGAPGQTVDAGRLIDGSATLAQAIAALHPMQDLTRGFGQKMVDEFDSFRSLISTGEGVQDSTHLIGINAVLSCMRLGQDGAALKVVAEQLQVISHEVGGRFATIRSALAGLSTLGNQITSGTSRLVQQSIQMPEQLIGTMVPMVKAVVGHLERAQQAVARLQERLSRLSFDFRPADLHRRQLETLAAQAPIAVALPSARVSDAALAEIFGMFTMERERHAFRLVMPDRVEGAFRAESSDQRVAEDDPFFL